MNPWIYVSLALLALLVLLVFTVLYALDQRAKNRKPVVKVVEPEWFNFPERRLP